MWAWAWAFVVACVGACGGNVEGEAPAGAVQEPAACRPVYWEQQPACESKRLVMCAEQDDPGSGYITLPVTGTLPPIGYALWCLSS